MKSTMKVKHLFWKVGIIVLILGLASFTEAEKVTIWMIGDSTMADKLAVKAPETGWGSALKALVNENATVRNLAKNGRSSRSYLVEGRWSPICSRLKSGDFVIIQFGHNDAKEDTLRHTEPYTTYKENLKKYINETRAKGANPILCSSIVRRHFDGKGNLIDTHGDYLKAAREVAKETNTPFVDLEVLTREVVSKLGSEKSKSLYLFCKPGEYPNRKDGVQDSTHLNREGAHMVASLFENAVKAQKLSLKSYLK